MAGLKLECPPAQYPVSLAAVKNFLRVDDIDDDDDLLTGLIQAATEACENYTRRSFITKGWLQTLDSFPYYTDTIMSQMAYPPSYYALPRYSTTLWNYSQMIKLFRPTCIKLKRITYMASADSQFHDLVPQPGPWYPQTDYAPGDQVADPNGNVQTLVNTAPSGGDLISGVDPPTAAQWSQTLGDLTVEASPATAVWRCDGPLKNGEFGAFMVDTISEPARVFPGVGNPMSSNGYWPSVLYVPNAVQLHFDSGYGPNPSDVPQGCITGIMQTIADWYENRNPSNVDEDQLPRHVRAVLSTYRVLDFVPTRG